MRPKRSKIRRWYVLTPAVVLGIAPLIGLLAFFHPQVLKAGPDFSQPVPLDSVLVFQFNKPLNRSELVPMIAPDIQGEWTYDQPLFGRHLARTLRFTPSQPFAPETAYRVTLRGVTDVLTVGQETVYERTFTTIALPLVRSVIPADKTTSVSPSQGITVQLTAPRDDATEFRFRLEPSAPMVIHENEARDVYTLTPDPAFEQGTTYALAVDRTYTARDRTTHTIVFQSEAETLYQGTFEISPPPELADVAPTGSHALVTEPVRLTFSEPMKNNGLEERLIVEPETRGTLALSDDRLVLTFTPSEPLAYATGYSIKLAAGAQTEHGGFLPNDAEFSFTTIGPARITSISPNDGAAGIGVHASITMAFDQEVDHASAEQAFNLTPGVDGAFRWDGQTMSFTPDAAFANSTIYHIRLASGIASVHGQPSDRTYESAFMTADESVKLPVAIDFQDRPLSCEAAALKMALAGKGVAVTEDAIMAKVGFDPTRRANGVWGDPYAAFVGDINGKQNTTGYGVYWSPIAAAASAWRPAEAFTGWSVRQVTAEVSAGNPVMVWGVYGNGYRDDWQTPSGKTVLAWKGEHARTVIGFVGTPDNPSKLIINDPYAGQVTWTRDRFEADWAKFGNSGVVVR